MITLDYVFHSASSQSVTHSFISQIRRTRTLMHSLYIPQKKKTRVYPLASLMRWTGGNRNHGINP